MGKFSYTIAKQDVRIATICIGYADGYPRTLGNGHAYVLIHGKPAKTIGSICMDMCMVDITDIPDAKEGDDVVIFGERADGNRTGKMGRHYIIRDHDQYIPAGKKGVCE